MGHRRTRVTRTATDVLTYREGICYAKSHLAAALLRAAGIPSGICYQRLTLLDDDSAGYAVHALNTVWIASLGRWVRFDARGDKPGVDAQFSLDEERLAFPIRAQYRRGRLPRQSRDAPRGDRRDPPRERRRAEDVPRGLPSELDG